jgi:hypothetical protein
MSSKRPTRTPQLAEGIFENVCFAAGLSANRSHDDQFGWDFLVQFPGVRGSGPADLDPAGATCLVQVKSNRTDRSTIRLKLSNAFRFAQEPIPCFLVLLTFDANATSPSSVYLRHFWTGDIGAALKAVRKAHVQNATALHRRSYTIRFSEDERCELSTLPARMEALSAASNGNYGARKTAFANSVGYEDGFAHGTFTFDEGIDDEAFVDLMLGRIPDLPVSNISMQEKRFGMPGPQIIPDTRARLSILAEPKEACQVIVSPADGDGELTLAGDLYIAGIPNLPSSLCRVRVQTRVLELIVSINGPSALNVSYDLDEPLEICTLADLARLWSWVNSGEIKVALWARGKLLSHGSIKLASTSPAPPWHRLGDVMARLLEFIPARRWPTEARFTIRDLLLGLVALETFTAQVTKPGMSIGLGGLAPNFVELVAACRRYLAPAYLDFGSATLFAVIEAVVDRIEPNGDGYRVLLAKPKVHMRAAVAGTAGANLAFMQEQFALIRTERGGGGDVMIGTLGDVEGKGSPT